MSESNIESPYNANFKRKEKASVSSHRLFFTSFQTKDETL